MQKRDPEGSNMSLQSQDHRDIPDIIVNLRSKGVSRYVDLPEIIICGGQSAGKVSVVEAISGLSFSLEGQPLHEVRG